MQEQSEVTQHITSIGPASFGQYQSRCSCGWQSHVTSDAEAVGLMREHERENPILRLEPEPAEAPSYFKQKCGECGQTRGGHQVTEVGHKFVEPAQPKPDAAGKHLLDPNLLLQCAIDYWDNRKRGAEYADNMEGWRNVVRSYLKHVALSAPRNSALEDTEADVQFLNDFMRMQGHEIRDVWERIVRALGGE